MKDEIMLGYILFTVTVTMIITGSSADGLILLASLAGIWIMKKEIKELNKNNGNFFKTTKAEE